MSIIQHIVYDILSMMFWLPDSLAQERLGNGLPMTLEAGLNDWAYATTFKQGCPGRPQICPLGHRGKSTRRRRLLLNGSWGYGITRMPGGRKGTYGHDQGSSHWRHRNHRIFDRCPEGIAEWYGNLDRIRAPVGQWLEHRSRYRDHRIPERRANPAAPIHSIYSILNTIIESLIYSFIISCCQCFQNKLPKWMEQTVSDHTVIFGMNPGWNGHKDERLSILATFDLR